MLLHADARWTFRTDDTCDEKSVLNFYKSRYNFISKKIIIYCDNSCVMYGLYKKDEE